jgi:PRTRC genetic system protein E
MFELLSQMITKANLSGVTLMIRPSGQGRLSVTLCTESTDWKAEDPSLKAALSQPLNIEGNVLEIQSKMLSDLSQYSESFVRGAIESNVHKVCAKTDEAVNKAKKSASNSVSTDEEIIETVEDSDIKIGKEVVDPDLF